MSDVEWDSEKRERNIEERGVDFADAALIFEGIVLEARDERNEYGEVRYRALGHVGDEYYLVAYTWRGEDGRRRYQAILAGGA
jgi:hypothetical protein